MSIIRHPAVTPACRAVVAALRGNIDVQTFLHVRPAAAVGTAKRVYAVGAVPAQLDGRWVEVGNPTEGWDARFMRSGSRLSLLVNLWHTPVEGDDVSQTVVDDLWGLVAPALSVPLPLAAPHVMLAGTATLIGVTRDPDDRTWHGVVQYVALTKDLS